MNVGSILKYSVEYCQTHITLLWNSMRYVSSHKPSIQLKEYPHVVINFVAPNRVKN